MGEWNAHFPLNLLDHKMYENPNILKTFIAFYPNIKHGMTNKEPRFSEYLLNLSKSSSKRPYLSNVNLSIHFLNYFLPFQTKDIFMSLLVAYVINSLKNCVTLPCTPPRFFWADSGDSQR